MGPRGTLACALACGGALFGCSFLSASDAELSGDWGLQGTDGAGTADAAAPETCAPGTKRCGASCVSVSNPATGCASDSCAPCAFAHASALCVEGACALGACEERFQDCDRLPDTGCEADTQVSSSRCGSCTNACGAASPLCTDGVCVRRCSAIKATSRGARMTVPTTGMSVGKGDYTLEAWVRSLGEFVTGRDGYYVRLADTTHEGLPALGIRGTGHLLCEVVQLGGAPWEHLVSPGPVDGNWHHLACVRAAGVHRMFVDGREVGSRPSGTDVTSTEMGTIGGWPASPIPYDAPSALLGPTRYSRIARYAATFVPKTFWTIDEHTVAQYLVSHPFDGAVLVDEAGRDNDGTHVSGFVASEGDVPCVPTP